MAGLREALAAAEEAQAGKEKELRQLQEECALKDGALERLEAEMDELRDGEAAHDELKGEVVQLKEALAAAQRAGGEADAAASARANVEAEVKEAKEALALAEEAKKELMEAAGARREELEAEVAGLREALAAAEEAQVASVEDAVRHACAVKEKETRADEQEKRDRLKLLVQKVFPLCICARVWSSWALGYPCVPLSLYFILFVSPWAMLEMCLASSSRCSVRAGIHNSAVVDTKQHRC